MTNLTALIAKTERHDAEIKELREQTQELSATLRQLAADGQRDREAVEHTRRMAEKDHELLLLRVEAKLLRHDLKLPLTVSSVFDKDK